jgi:GNAT superfamily N-acetyltransferase
MTKATLHRLSADDQARALPLLEGRDHLLLLEAVIAGTAPGYVCVDDPSQPRALFASGPEGHYLVGDPGDGSFTSALAAHIQGELLPKAREQGWASFVLYHEPEWALAMEELFPGQVLVRNCQRYFCHQSPLPDWRAALPQGVTALPIDRDLLDRDDLGNIQWLRDFCEGDYASPDAFLAHGFGMCLVQEGEIVSWCTTDCVVGRRAEIGITTASDHRRKGYGTAAAAATVEEARRRGITHVGWHCFQQNLASAATALRAGFVEQYSHAVVSLWLNPVDGLLVNGNLALMAGDYAAAAELYRAGLALWAETRDVDKSAVLAERAYQARYRYQAACAAALAGDAAMALDELETAWAYGVMRQAAV